MMRSTVQVSSCRLSEGDIVTRVNKNGRLVTYCLIRISLRSVQVRKLNWSSACCRVLHLTCRIGPDEILLTFTWPTMVSTQVTWPFSLNSWRPFDGGTRPVSKPEHLISHLGRFLFCFEFSFFFTRPCHPLFVLCRFKRVQNECEKKNEIKSPSCSPPTSSHLSCAISLLFMIRRIRSHSTSLINAARCRVEIETWLDRRSKSITRANSNTRADRRALFR